MMSECMSPCVRMQIDWPALSHARTPTHVYYGGMDWVRTCAQHPAAFYMRSRCVMSIHHTVNSLGTKGIGTYSHEYDYHNMTSVDYQHMFDMVPLPVYMYINACKCVNILYAVCAQLPPRQIRGSTWFSDCGYIIGGRPAIEIALPFLADIEKCFL